MHIRASGVISLSLSCVVTYSLILFFFHRDVSLEEDITCADIKGEIATRMRVRRTDVEMFLAKPDGTTMVLLSLFLFSLSLSLSLLSPLFLYALYLTVIL